MEIGEQPDYPEDDPILFSHRVSSSLWDPPYADACIRQARASILVNDEAVFVASDDKPMQPVFENGLNIHYMTQLNRLTNTKAVFFCGNNAPNPYIWQSHATVNANHTGLRDLVPGAKLAVVPVMCQLSTNQRFKNNHYFLETVSLERYQYELNQLATQIRSVMCAKSLIEQLNDEDLFWTIVYKKLKAALISNSLWYDMLEAGRKAAGGLVVETHILRDMFTTMMEYWKNFIGAGDTDSGSSYPGCYKTPLLTPFTVLQDLYEAMNNIFNNANKKQTNKGDGEDENAKIENNLKNTHLILSAIEMCGNFNKSITVQPVGVIQTASSNKILPGCKMTVCISY